MDLLCVGTGLQTTALNGLSVEVEGRVQKNSETASRVAVVRLHVKARTARHSKVQPVGKI
jgi:hypothetical protein